MSGWQLGGSPKRRRLWPACRRAKGRSRRGMTQTSSSSIRKNGRSFAPRPCARASVTGPSTEWTLASPCARSTCGAQPSGETDGDSARRPAASSGRLGLDWRSPEYRVLRELALQARRGSMAGVQRSRERQAQQLGADAHHLPSQVGLWCLLADAARQDCVADECVVRDHEAHASGSVARSVYDRELELAELET